MSAGNKSSLECQIVLEQLELGCEFKLTCYSHLVNQNKKQYTHVYSLLILLVLIKSPFFNWYLPDTSTSLIQVYTFSQINVPLILLHIISCPTYPGTHYHVPYLSQYILSCALLILVHIISYPTYPSTHYLMPYLSQYTLSPTPLILLHIIS